ncbi:uncharacterized protein LY79DRAFT_97954 [Colletotrichum navitas]|uniref:Uncharacterized protein n=1 Tax=Colletotrichum navitas TaxID=681940 RepID=A0AAD8PK33_9PEZI|nr:uncharacterized protein LY79DRAFT_97954 [Colletotrichum navitas]KAK1566281.1 hypothetical protein LY79DRAFT_97954 [Colletotrichum navitas]
MISPPGRGEHRPTVTGQRLHRLFPCLQGPIGGRPEAPTTTITPSILGHFFVFCWPSDNVRGFGLLSVAGAVVGSFLAHLSCFSGCETLYVLGRKAERAWASLSPLFVG